MKKIFLFLLLLISFDSFAQLPREFYGCTIGESTPSIATSQLKKSGFSITDEGVSNGFKALSFDKGNFIEFSLPWQFGAMLFRNNVLYDVSYYHFYPNYNMAKISFDAVFNYLNSNYGRYKKSASEKSASFSDGKISCELKLNEKKDPEYPYILTLTFY